MIKSIEINVTTGERVETLMSAQEETDALARIATEAAAKPENDRIAGLNAQITTLEQSVTKRMEREALLNSAKAHPATGKTAKQMIQAIEDQIAALQAQL